MKRLRMPGASLMLLAGLAAAQGGLRDPTEPPAAARPPAADAGSAEPAQPRQIVMSEGRAYVIERGRRLGVGDLLGTARIERIDDGGVWLREGGSLRRVPLYAGVAKRPAEPAATPPRSPRAPKKDDPT